MKSAILQQSVKEQDKRIYKVGEKLYKITLKTERKYNEILTIAVAGVYTSKILFFSSFCY